MSNDDFESQDDFELFHQMMGDVKPIKQDTANDPDYLSIDHAPMLKPDDHVEFKRDGVQDGVYKKMRLGKYPI